MSKSEKENNKLDLDLEFPSGKDFFSKRAPISFEQMIKLSEEMLPKLNADPNYQKERRAKKIIKTAFELKE